MQKQLILIIVLALTSQTDLYDVMSGNVSKLTSKNWMNNLEKGIQKERVFIVHFYEEDNGKSYEFTKEMNSRADKFKGIIEFSFVNCLDEKKLCKKEAPETLPALKVYPPVPLPAQVFDLNIKKALNTAVRYIKNNVQKLNEENIQRYLKTDQTLPKVLFFTDKKKTSLIIKSLSSRLKEKMHFGQVQDTEIDIIDMFDIQKFPSLLIVKNGEKKPIVFKEKFVYKEIFEFLNVFSEQFVPQKTGTTEEEKPWLFQAVPELHDKSAKEVCVGLAKTLCVITFSPGVPEKSVLDQLKNLQKSFDNKKSRISLKFVWINSDLHKDWVKDMEVEKGKLVVRVLKSGRRTKFIKMKEEFSIEGISDTIEKILGGDARSVSLRKGLPAFTSEL